MVLVHVVSVPRFKKPVGTVRTGLYRFEHGLVHGPKSISGAEEKKKSCCARTNRASAARYKPHRASFATGTPSSSSCLVVDYVGRVTRRLF